MFNAKVGNDINDAKKEAGKEGIIWDNL